MRDFMKLRKSLPFFALDTELIRIVPCLMIIPSCAGDSGTSFTTNPKPEHISSKSGISVEAYFVTVSRTNLITCAFMSITFSSYGERIRLR